MTRADALAVWEDLTRELWPEADVEKSALRIEHQAHVDWLVGSEACECAGPYALREPGEPRHHSDCPMMAAFEALDMPEGHAETGRAWDEGSGWNRTAYIAQEEPLFGNLSRVPFERMEQVRQFLDAGLLTPEQAREILNTGEILGVSR